MKFIHLSDLHLGKRLNGYLLTEEQRDILQKITAVILEEQPDAMLIAGDIYDKSVPSEEAVQLLDAFLNDLSEHGEQTYMISGNHDSAERLSFASRLMEKSGIHIAPAYQGRVKAFELRDEYGPLYLWLLPFVKPLHVRAAWPGDEIVDYSDAISCAIAHMEIDPSKRNVLVAHQYVSGAERSDSEEITIGGLDEVSAEAFSAFDYVALGHLHRPQNVALPDAALPFAASEGEKPVPRPLIRYAGSPLPYSFSEAGQEKSLTVVEIGEKGEAVSLRTVPLSPLRGLQKLRGSFAELTAAEYLRGSEAKDHYLHITLTDEQDVPDAAIRLKALYPYLMTIEYDNTRTRTAAVIGGAQDAPKKSPLELFEELYRLQNGASLNAAQRTYLEDKIEALKEVEG